MSEPIKGDIFRVVYNDTAGDRKNILVLATEGSEANQYVESLENCSIIAIPAMLVASNVHLAPEFFETIGWEEEFTPEGPTNQYDSSE